MTDQENVTAESASHRQKMRPERKRLLTLVAIVFIVFGVLWLLFWLLFGQFNIYTDDAYVNGNQVQLMAQTPGTVIEINTDDTHLALEGQPLVKLDPADAEVALNKARANLANVVRTVRQAYEAAEQALALLNLRNADLLKVQMDVDRRQGLVKLRAISREEMQHYETALKAAKAKQADALHRYVSAVAFVDNAYLYDHPLVMRAKAEFKQAYLRWIRTTIYSPLRGYVAKRNVQVGQQVTTNTALLSVVSLTDVWVDANYKENQLARIRIGQDVKLTADANDFTYHGKVVGVGAGTGSVFSLLPPQNATGNWIKIVQRLPVRIALDPKELATHPLQIGLSMRVTIYTRWLKGNMLSQQSNAQPIYKTPIYNDQLQHADKEIATILEANAPNIALNNPATAPQKE